MEITIVGGEPINQSIEPLRLARTPDSAPESPSYMFTEDQISKQLVDMKEQTEFMKKFRCALGIALQEIKTLRTTMSAENVRNNEVINSQRKRACSGGSYPSLYQQEVTFAPQIFFDAADATDKLRDDGNADLAKEDSIVTNLASVPTCDSKQCVCSQFGHIDLTSLSEYLSKMSVSGSKSESEGLKYDGCVNKTAKSDRKSKNLWKAELEKLQQTGTACMDFIRRVDELKSTVADRNAMVTRLCKELTQARLVRVKRESKLEQKLNEAKEWKTKYEHTKQAHDKQIKITRGLRVALNAERQRVKSSEKMLNSLEQTRSAFHSLKAQAGELMKTLDAKDVEIAELNAKLDEIQRKDGAYLYIQDSDQAVSPIHGSESPSGDKEEPASPLAQCVNSGTQTNGLNCDDCDNLRKELSAVREKYDTLLRSTNEYRSSNVEHRQHSHESSMRGRYLLPEGGDRDMDLYDSDRGFHSLPQGHPYDYRRSRTYPSYTSPESYRKFSRPQLRKQLHFQSDSRPADRSPDPPRDRIAGPNEPSNNSGTCVLSPIDETEEMVNDAGNISVSSTVKAYGSAQKSISEESCATTRDKTHGASNSPNRMSGSREAPPYDSLNHPESVSWEMPYDIHGNAAHERKHELAHESPRDVVHGYVKQESHHYYSDGDHDNSSPDSREHSLHEKRISEHPRFHEIGRNFPIGKPYQFDGLHGYSSTNHGDHRKANTEVPHEGHPTSSAEENPDMGKKTKLKTAGSPPAVKTGFDEPEPTKASYLELGNDSTPSPSTSRNSSVELAEITREEPQQHLFLNSFIRKNNRNELNDVSPDSRTYDTSPVTSHTLHSVSTGSWEGPPHPEQFGVIWHPALINPPPPVSVGSDDASSISDLASDNSLGFPSSNVTSHPVIHHGKTSRDITPHKQKKSQRGSSRYVSYKGHKIDVTKFSIHSFRDVVWTLDGESADDFIKFLASLAKKLNSSPKWAGKHAMGDPKDWLALRGLF